MVSYNTFFRNDEEINAFVMDAEKRFKDQILDIANCIKAMQDIKFLTLSGPTCSGKTTTSYILEKELEIAGNTVRIVSIDDFYRNHKDILSDEKPDYESISAIDFDVFSECVDKILKGETAHLPKYDFQTGTRTGYIPYDSKDHEIVIFEGIQAMYPEILAKLPREKSKSIYISVEDDVCAYGTHFNKREVRFYRRLIRDYLFRNASPERTLDLWAGVIENENKNIIPHSHKADFTINSFLAYELCVIKPYLLNQIPYSPENPCEAQIYSHLLEKFEAIPEIPSHFVPKDSVFREFIGGF